MSPTLCSSHLPISIQPYIHQAPHMPSHYWLCFLFQSLSASRKAFMGSSKIVSCTRASTSSHIRSRSYRNEELGFPITSATYGIVTHLWSLVLLTPQKRQHLLVLLGRRPTSRWRPTKNLVTPFDINREPPSAYSHPSKPLPPSSIHPTSALIPATPGVHFV